MICKICGKEIKDGEQFCNFCGASQSAKPSQFDVTSSLVEQERVIKKKAAKRTLILVIAIIVVVVALFVALLGTGILGNIFGNGGNDQPAEEPTSTIEAPAQPAAEETETSPAVTDETETSPAVTEATAESNTTIAAASKEDEGYVRDAGQKDFIGTWTCDDYDESSSVYDEVVVSFDGSGRLNTYSKKKNEGTWSTSQHYSISEGMCLARDGSYALVENDDSRNGPYSEYNLVLFISPDALNLHSKKQYVFEKTGNSPTVTNELRNTYGTWYGQNNTFTVVFADDESFTFSSPNGDNGNGWWQLFSPMNGSALEVQAYSDNDDMPYIFTYNADNDFSNYESGILANDDLTFQKTPKQDSSAENTPTNGNTNQNTTNTGTNK